MGHGPMAGRLEQLRIVVLGYVVRGPLGGMAWQSLQYATGLARLGHEVFLVEDSDDYVSCFDPSRNVMDTDPSYGLRFAGDAFDRLGLGDRWAYYDAHTGRWLGPCAARAPSICRHADLCLNVSGVNPDRPWLADIPSRVLIDTDPAFTQIRHLCDPTARQAALRHTAFFTIGENFGSAGSIPDDGLPWRRTRQPIVLDAWPATPGRAGGKLTTVMQWDSYPALEHDGARYGMKSESFLPYLDLPKKAGPVFELVLPCARSLREDLRSRGWSVRQPRAPTRDPWSYQRYIQRSKAEFSVAKHGYVASASGWFSERSACYMASGRPVVVQDTGFSRVLPTGSGLLSFTTPDEAAAAVDELSRDYAGHCRAARQIAEAYFDARTILSELVESALEATCPSRPVRQTEEPGGS